VGSSETKDFRVVHREYASYRKGKAKWGEDDEKDNLFVELLVAVQDAVIEKKGT
jgi:hypothetical protein